MRNLLLIRMLAVVAVIVLISGIAAAEGCFVSTNFASPSDNDFIQDAILDELHSARYIDIAMYSFTNEMLADELIEAHERGAFIVILADDKQATVSGSQLQRLANSGITVLVDASSTVFNHKFVIIDMQTVITGSYNWSANANNDNFDNAVVISCLVVAEAYSNQFHWMIENYEFSSL